MPNRAPVEVTPTPLVRAFEVWIPDPRRAQLRFQAGFYRGAQVTASAVPALTVAYGQGLPGQVFERKEPMILEDLTAYRGVVRPAIAARSGFSAGVGWPVLYRQQVIAVVTLLFATPSASAGAFEIWRPRADGQQMVWADGFYGDLRDFQAVSRTTAFAPGEGLPGQVLASRAPILFENLSMQRGFVRSDAAAEAALEAGLGFPVLDGDALQQVVLLLTSAQTPITRVMEVWKPDPQGVLALDAGYYGPLDDFAAISRATRFERGVGLPGRVFAERAPVVFERLTREAGFIRYDAAARAGLDAALGFPVFRGNAVEAVVVLFN